MHSFLILYMNTVAITNLRNVSEVCQRCFSKCSVCSQCSALSLMWKRVCMRESNTIKSLLYTSSMCMIVRVFAYSTFKRVSYVYACAQLQDSWIQLMCKNTHIHTCMNIHSVCQLHTQVMHSENRLESGL